MTIQFCWSHVRRDFIRAAGRDTDLLDWRDQWLARFATLFRLHRGCLEHYDPDRQSTAFSKARRRLKREVDRLFTEAERQHADLAQTDRRQKALRSLLKHRKGLCVFLEHPATPLHNNRSEAILRGPAIGRKLSFGSDSEAGAAMTATMYSVIATLRMNNIDVRRWLQQWLEACAANGGRPPQDLSPWLPWSMSAARRHELQG